MLVEEEIWIGGCVGVQLFGVEGVNERTSD